MNTGGRRLDPLFMPPDAPKRRGRRGRSIILSGEEEAEGQKQEFAPPLAVIPTHRTYLLVQFFLFLFAWRRCCRLEFGGFVGLG